MTLSSSWAYGHAERMGRTSDKATRLALALGAIRSVIRVIDRHLPPMDVQWARVDETAIVRSMSFSDLRGGKMHLNPCPITDGRLDHGAALDVCVGFGMHEASHSQESRDRYEVLIRREPMPKVTMEEIVDRKRAIRDEKTVFSAETGQPMREVPAFEPMRIAAYLWNVVEDVRIEQVTSGHWPGFAPYFDAVLDYMWSDMREHHELPVEYGPDVAGKLKTVFLSCRYPAQAALLPAPMQPEVGWWTAWQHDYLSDRVDTAATIQRALDHLAEDKATKKELDQMASEEAKERERGEKMRAQIERLIREGVEGAYGVCITSDGEVIPLDAKTADAVDKLVREGLIEHKTIIKAVGCSNPPIRVRKPEETAESKRAYVGRPNAQSAALRAALVFRNSAPQHDVKLLKSGELDDEELYRWGMGDYRVFSERVVEAKPDVFMGLLCDISGSMRGQKLQTTQRLAQLLTWAVHDQEGIQTQVWAHTADVDDTASEVYRIWERGDPLSRLGLISTLPHMNNADGFAIGEVVRQMMDVDQPERVLIVLADGQPSAHGYGGQPAFNHIRSVVRWAATRNVRVIQVAIDDYLEMDDQIAMFSAENVIPYESDAALPRQLTQLMSRYLG